MESQATVDVIRGNGRQGSNIPNRPRQNVYDDAPSQDIGEIADRTKRPSETQITPLGGPAYAGRA